MKRTLTEEQDHVARLCMDSNYLTASHERNDPKRNDLQYFQIRRQIDRRSQLRKDCPGTWKLLEPIVDDYFQACPHPFDFVPLELKQLQTFLAETENDLLCDVIRLERLMRIMWLSTPGEIQFLVLKHDLYPGLATDDYGNSERKPTFLALRRIENDVETYRMQERPFRILQAHHSALPDGIKSPRKISKIYRELAAAGLLDKAS